MAAAAAPSDPLRARSRSLSRLRSLSREARHRPPAAGGGAAVGNDGDDAARAAPDDGAARAAPAGAEGDGSAALDGEEALDAAAARREEEARELLARVRRLQAEQKREMDALLAMHGRLLGQIERVAGEERGGNESEEPIGSGCVDDASPKPDRSDVPSPLGASRRPRGRSASAAGGRGTEASGRRAASAPRTDATAERDRTDRSSAPLPSSSAVDGRTEGTGRGMRSASPASRGNATKGRASVRSPSKPSPPRSPAAAADWRALLPPDAGGIAPTTPAMRLRERLAVGRALCDAPRTPRRDEGGRRADRGKGLPPRRVFDEPSGGAVVSAPLGAAKRSPSPPGPRGKSLPPRRPFDEPDAAHQSGPFDEPAVDPRLGRVVPERQPRPSSVRPWQSSVGKAAVEDAGRRDHRRNDSGRVLRETEPGVYEVSSAEETVNSRRGEMSEASSADDAVKFGREETTGTGDTGRMARGKGGATSVGRSVRGTMAPGAVGGAASSAKGKAAPSPARWRGHSLPPGRSFKEHQAPEQAGNVAANVVAAPSAKGVRGGRRSASASPARRARGVLPGRLRTKKEASSPEAAPCLRSSSCHHAESAANGAIRSCRSEDGEHRRVTFEDDVHLEDAIADKKQNEGRTNVQLRVSVTPVERMRTMRNGGAVARDPAPESRRERRSEDGIRGRPLPSRAVRRGASSASRDAKGSTRDCSKCREPLAPEHHGSDDDTDDTDDEEEESTIAESVTLNTLSWASPLMNVSLKDYFACGAALEAGAGDGRDGRGKGERGNGEGDGPGIIDNEDTLSASFELEPGRTESETKIVERSLGKEVAEVVSVRPPSRFKAFKRQHRRSQSVDSFLEMGAPPVASIRPGSVPNDALGKLHSRPKNGVHQVPRRQPRGAAFRARPPLFPKAPSMVPDIAKAFSFSSFSGGGAKMDEGEPEGPPELLPLVIPTENTLGSDQLQQQQPRRKEQSVEAVSSPLPPPSSFDRSDGSSDSPTGIGELPAFRERHAAPRPLLLSISEPPRKSSYRCTVLEEEEAANASVEIELIEEEEEVMIPRILDFDDSSVFSI